MRSMGRRRKHNTDMPARVYLQNGWWFFVPKTGPKVKLAKEADRSDALRAYADLMDARPRAGTVGDLLDRYRREILPAKGVKTRREQERQIGKLAAVFGAVAVGGVTSTHIAQYLDASEAKVSANREIALLSHAYTKAVRWGLVQTNPCRGVERNKEKPRDRYIAHEEFIVVMEAAPAMVAVMMALAYLTGQREGDLLRLRRSAITADGLLFQQGKTGKRLLIHWTPALRWAVEQAGKLQPDGIGSLWVVAQRDGKPYSESGFMTAWQKHIRRCHTEGLIAERFTFHDIRAKAGSDAKDGRLLGHMDPRTLRRIYLRKPEAVGPVN
jgi:integrase